MTLRIPGLSAAAVLALVVLAAAPVSNAHAACRDKKIVAMANEGRSVKAIAKSCNMPVAKVRAVVDGDSEPANPPAKPPVQASPQSQAQASQKSAPAKEPEPKKGLPSGAGLASCDCKGSVPYGNKEPELRCQSGVSIATPCPGYCSPYGIAPWRRICS